MNAISSEEKGEMEGIRKMRIFVAKLEDLLRMSEDDKVEFVNKATDGFSLRYTESAKTRWLSRIKECPQIAYMEMQFNELEGVEIFD